MSLFHRYQVALFAYYMGGLLMAVVFGFRIYSGGGSPITPEIYGAWVYQFPAIMWVAIQIFITAGAALTCALGYNRISGTFAFALGVYLAVFAALAMGAGASGTILMTGAGFWLSPLSFMAGGVSMWGGNDER